MTDIYFNVKNGRLKARLGDIKDILIQYCRENKKRPKRSDFLVSVIDKDSNIIPSLVNALGVKVIVKKEREIYIIDNVRFHLDKIRNLGHFIEIEARGETADEIKKLHKQINEYMNILNVKKAHLLRNLMAIYYWLK
jgi:predicted adenylyl cyclase CyaB